MDLLREWVAPEVRVVLGIEVDSAHAHFGRIRGAQERWFLGDDLGQVRRSVAEARREGGEGVDVVT